MDDSKYTFELIEQYLAGELEGEALLSFKEDLANDQALQAAVEQQRNTHKAVDIYAQIRTKDQVRALHEQVKLARRQQRRLVIPLAATIALLVAVGLWLFVGNSSTQVTPDELVAANFDLYPNRITTMGDTDSLLAEGMSAYEEQDFETALRVFSAMPNDLPESDLIHLYGGISYLGLHEPDNGLLVLGRIEEGSPYREAARWYEALAYLQKKEITQARTILEEIVQEEAYPGEKARQLLDNLRD